MKLVLSFFMALLSTTAMAQFADIRWMPSDTLPPLYQRSYALGSDYAARDYAFSMEYVETAPATKEELERYKVDVVELADTFAVSTHLGVVRKKGQLDVSVYPFAKCDGKAVKLMSFKPVLRTSLVSRHSRHSLRGFSAAPQHNSNKFDSAFGWHENSSLPTPHSSLSSGRWVKIRVSSEGIYELTKSQLSSMGFSDPSKVRLYGYNVPVLPEGDIQTLPDDVQEIPLWRKSNGNALFYSCGLTRWTRRNLTRNIGYTHANNPYSNHLCYFLTDSGEGEPLTFPDVTVDAAGAVDAPTGVGRILIDKDEFSFINTGRTFFEAYDFANGNRRDYTLPLPGNVGGKVTVAMQFAVAGSTKSSLHVMLGDSTLGTIPYNELVSYIYGVVGSRTYYIPNVQTDNLVLTLSHNRSAGVSGHLDYISAAYERTLDLAGVNFLPFDVLSNALNRYQISSATASTRLWHVWSPEVDNNKFYNVVGTLGADGVFSAVDQPVPGKVSGERYVALDVEASYPQPEVVGAIENQNLHATEPVDLVIIVPANGILTEQAQRLADAHTAKDGMRCLVVTADKIYNEFSSGTPDATAYRRFMKMLYDRAATEADMPKNLLLFGDGVWDNRIVTDKLRGYSQDDYLLCYESLNSVSHTDSYVLEDYYALLDDGEGTAPLKDKMDIGVGRIPVTSPVEAEKVVTKLISYMNNVEVGAWKNTICFLGDDGDKNMHMEDAESVLDTTQLIHPDYRYRRIYWDAYRLENTSTGASFPAAYSDINKQMDEGALVMNYTGHGAAYSLSHEKVLQVADFHRWNSPRLPLWVTAACDVSPFDMNEQNIGEAALLNPNGAAMGVLSTTRTVYSVQNLKLNRNFMVNVLKRNADGSRVTLGEALSRAKNDIIISWDTQTHSSRDEVNKAHFVLLGDPAMALATPDYSTVIDEFAGQTDASATSPLVNAGSVVTVRGHIVDPSGSLASDFNGLVSPSVYDNLERIVCFNGSRQDVPAPMEYYERLGLLYSGSDSVRNGRFEFTFPVPLDINYSNESGLLRIYAVNNDRTIEAHGTYDRFLVGGTNPELTTDTLGPQVALYLNSDRFVPGGKVNATPLFVANITDTDGINTTGSGVGHDLTLAIDNDPLLTFILNGDFVPSPGDYTSGTVSYRLPRLDIGQHTLTFRAWDVLNNSTVITLPFEVVPVVRQSEVYDMAGRKVANFNDTDVNLQPGIYIIRTIMINPDGTTSEETRKELIQ